MSNEPMGGVAKSAEDLLKDLISAVDSTTGAAVGGVKVVASAGGTAVNVNLELIDQLRHQLLEELKKAI